MHAGESGRGGVSCLGNTHRRPTAPVRVRGVVRALVEVRPEPHAFLFRLPQHVPAHPPNPTENKHARRGECWCLSVCMPACVSVSLSLCLYVSLSHHLCLCLSVSLCLFLSPPACPSEGGFLPKVLGDEHSRQMVFHRPASTTATQIDIGARGAGHRHERLKHRTLIVRVYITTVERRCGIRVCALKLSGGGPGVPWCVLPCCVGRECRGRAR